MLQRSCVFRHVVQVRAPSSLMWRVLMLKHDGSEGSSRNQALLWMLSYHVRGFGLLSDLYQGVEVGVSEGPEVLVLGAKFCVSGASGTHSWRWSRLGLSQNRYSVQSTIRYDAYDVVRFLNDMQTIRGHRLIKKHTICIRFRCLWCWCTCGS